MKNLIERMLSMKQSKTEMATYLASNGNTNNILEDDVVFLKEFQKLLDINLIENQKTTYNENDWLLYCYYCIQELLVFLPAISKNFPDIEAFILNEIEYYNNVESTEN